MASVEDFSFSLQNAIGGKVIYVWRNGYKQAAHAILLKNGLVYDSVLKWPVRESDYPHRLVIEMVFSRKGVTIDN